MIKQALCICALLVLNLATGANVAEDAANRTTTLDALRGAGVRIAQAAENAAAGQSPAAPVLQELRRALRAIRVDANADLSLSEKYRAVSLAYGELERSASADAKRGSMPQAQPTRIDTE